MDVIRDVLDNQLVDRHQRKMGKVDGIAIELRDGKPPRLAYIEVGMSTLARRLHPRLAHWVAALQGKWGAKHGESFRIPFSKILHVGIDVNLDLEAETTPVLDYEKWLRENIIGRIPGAN
jgi:hypothetical protein